MNKKYINPNGPYLIDDDVKQKDFTDIIKFK